MDPAKMTTARRHLERALTLLEAFVDDEPCWHNHHGACENHSAGEVDHQCGNAAAREFLDEVRPGWSG